MNDNQNLNLNNNQNNLNQNINETNTLNQIGQQVEVNPNVQSEYQNPEMQVINSHPDKDMGDKIIEKVENFVNTTDYSDDYTKEDVKNNKTNAMICYVPLAVLYFLFTGKYKKSNYLFFHANQGLSVTIVWVLAFIISIVLSSVFSIRSLYVNAYTPGWVNLISYTLYFIALLLSGFGFVNTLNENSKELPVIGKIKLLK